MSTLILIAGAALILYAIYGTIQKARGKSKSSCCGTSETVVTQKVADTDKSHLCYAIEFVCSGKAAAGVIFGPGLAALEVAVIAEYRIS